MKGRGHVILPFHVVDVITLTLKPYLAIIFAAMEEPPNLLKFGPPPSPPKAGGVGLFDVSSSRDDGGAMAAPTLLLPDKYAQLFYEDILCVIKEI